MKSFQPYLVFLLASTSLCLSLGALGHRPDMVLIARNAPASARRFTPRFQKRANFTPSASSTPDRNRGAAEKKQLDKGISTSEVVSEDKTGRESQEQIQKYEARIKKFKSKLAKEKAKLKVLEKGNETGSAEKGQTPGGSKRHKSASSFLLANKNATPTLDHNEKTTSLDTSNPIPIINPTENKINSLVDIP